MKIEPSWVEWAKKEVISKNDIFYKSFSDAIFEFNKKTKTFKLICCLPQWINSETESINKKVFSMIGYKYIRPLNVPTNAKTILKKIFRNIMHYPDKDSFNTLLYAIGVIYNIQSVEDKTLNKILDYIEKIGIKNPINPVSIRNGSGVSIALGRTWLESRETKITDASHKFDPSATSETNYEKIMVFAIYDDSNYFCDMTIDDEQSFIEVYQKLLSPVSAVKLIGTDKHRGENSRSLLFSRNGDLLQINLTDEEEKSYSINVSYKTFVEGLSYLFVAGELE